MAHNACLTVLCEPWCWFRSAKTSQMRVDTIRLTLFNKKENSKVLALIFEMVNRFLQLVITHSFSNQHFESILKVNAHYANFSPLEN